MATATEKKNHMAKAGFIFPLYVNIQYLNPIIRFISETVIMENSFIHRFFANVDSFLIRMPKDMYVVNYILIHFKMPVIFLLISVN